MYYPVDDILDLQTCCKSKIVIATHKSSLYDVRFSKNSLEDLHAA